MKKTLLWIVGIIAVLCIAIACIWGGEIATLRSIKSVDGNQYLYKMEYKAGYDLDDLIANDIDENAELLNYVVGRIGKGLPLKIKSSQVADDDGKMETMNCTSFQAAKADAEGYLFGRNYDFFKNPTMVTVSHPKKGYSSIACSDMSHFGYSLEKLPASFATKLNCQQSRRFHIAVNARPEIPGALLAEQRPLVGDLGYLEIPVKLQALGTDGALAGGEVLRRVLSPV